MKFEQTTEKSIGFVRKRSVFGTQMLFFLQEVSVFSVKRWLFGTAYYQAQEKTCSNSDIVRNRRNFTKEYSYLVVFERKWD